MKTRSVKPLLLVSFVVLLAGSLCLRYASPVLGAQENAEAEEFARGPHNGRLLVDGNFSVELAIFETGVPPEYHAWTVADERQLNPAEVQLEVQLIRLGGQVETFDFAVQNDYLRSLGGVAEPHSFDVTVTASYNNVQHRWAFPSYEGRVHMNAEIAAAARLTTAVAGPGLLQQQVRLYGQVQADPERVRELHARFPGVIRSVRASIGQQVSAGAVLATVEANESLRSYDITSPTSGVVVARSANEGESTHSEPLFTVADYRQLLAEFPVFPLGLEQVRVGQTVTVMNGEQPVSSTISALLPGTGRAPTMTARVQVDNSAGNWNPGVWVNAFVTVAEIQVPLLIDNRALQSFRDWQVVFIKVGDDYEIRPLTLGRSDGAVTEVLAGLEAGASYVVGNSYLLKADLEKSGASHDH